MSRIRFRGRDWVKSIFLDSNVDPGTCLSWQNHGDLPVQCHVILQKSFIYADLLLLLSMLKLVYNQYTCLMFCEKSLFSTIL